MGIVADADDIVAATSVPRDGGSERRAAVQKDSNCYLSNCSYLLVYAKNMFR